MADKVFINKITVVVTGSAAEEAHPHGLDGVPDLVILVHGTDTEVTIGGTAATATNIYLDNANVADKPGVVLVIKKHSLMSY